MVGTMSVQWWYWFRTSPFDAMPAGQWMTSGSQTPPWYVYRLNMRYGVENAVAQPVGQGLYVFGLPSWSTIARFCSRSSGEPPDTLPSLAEPFGEPSPEAPLSAQ